MTGNVIELGSGTAPESEISKLGVSQADLTRNFQSGKLNNKLSQTFRYARFLKRRLKCIKDSCVL